MLSADQRAFIEQARVARLATIGPDGTPHLVPVCFALLGESVFVPIDEKPKRPGVVLQRLRNIAARPSACLLVDHYQEDWSGLGWVMLRGRAEILTAGAEYAAAQVAAQARYKQLAAMRLDGLAVIALRVSRVRAWGAVGPSSRAGAASG